MTKWRFISGLGVIIGIVTIVLDSKIENIPIAIIILLEIVSIFLLFSGLILRKRKTRQEK